MTVREKGFRDVVTVSLRRRRRSGRRGHRRTAAIGANEDLQQHILNGRLEQPAQLRGTAQVLGEHVADLPGQADGEVADPAGGRRLHRPVQHRRRGERVAQDGGTRRRVTSCPSALTRYRPSGDASGRSLPWSAPVALLSLWPRPSGRAVPNPRPPRPRDHDAGTASRVTKPPVTALLTAPRGPDWPWSALRNPIACAYHL